jgi:hypothetical protein
MFTFIIPVVPLACASPEGVAPADTPLSVTVTVNSQFNVLVVGVYVNALVVLLVNPGQLVLVAGAHEYRKLPVPPEGVADIKTLWPISIVFVVTGETKTEGEG